MIIIYLIFLLALCCLPMVVGAWAGYFLLGSLFNTSRSAAENKKFIVITVIIGLVLLIIVLFVHPL